MQRKWPVGSGATLGFALAFVVIVATALITALNLRTIVRNEELVVHTHDVLHKFDDVMTALLQSESSQRGYLNTALEPYREEFNAALPMVSVHMAELRRMTADNPAQKEHLDELQKLVDERIATMKEGIEIRLKGGSSEDVMEFLGRGTGKKQMDSVRTVFKTMKDEENRLLAVRATESTASHHTALLTTLLAALLGLGMVVAAFVLARREVESRQQAADELEGRVRDRTSELGAANAALSRSNRELEQFASVASHDLQEPLRKIEAFGDRLKTRNRDQLDEQGRDYLDRVLQSASRMRTLITDLLSFSRVATRAQPFVPVDLAKVTREVVSDLEGRIQQVDGRVDVNGLPTIEADPTQMRQLMQNLIANALKFRKPDQSPTVIVRSQVEQTGEDIDRVRLEVQDNGIGFEETYLDRIFEVFQRLHGRNEYEGTGIGLAICRKIAERHGGTITARSRPNEGATFVVTLPLKQKESEAR